LTIAVRTRRRPRYRTAEHTADRAVWVYGRDARELLKNAAWAVVDQVCDARRVRPRVARPLRVAGADPSARLVGLMNELIYRLDAEHLVLPHLTLLAVGPRGLRGVARGEALAERHGYKGALKAATYHDLHIERTRTGWRARVVLDV
jgi:SHS2 domain-containing protein